MFVKTIIESREFLLLDELNKDDEIALDVIDNQMNTVIKHGETLTKDLLNKLEKNNVSGIVVKRNAEKWVYREDSSKENIKNELKTLPSDPFPESFLEIFESKNLKRLSQYISDVLDTLCVQANEGLQGDLQKILDRTMSNLESLSALSEKKDSFGNDLNIGDIVKDIRKGETISPERLNEFPPELQREVVHILNLRRSIFNDLVELAESRTNVYKSRDALLDESFESSNEHSRNYNQFINSLTTTIPFPLESSILTSTEQESAHKVLKPPVYDDKDLVVRDITAWTMQILLSFLFRGVLLKDRINELRKFIKEQISPEEDVVKRMTYPENSKFYLLSHKVNVLVLSLLVAEQVGLDNVQEEQLTIASILHDIGMLTLNPNYWAFNRGGSVKYADKLKDHPVESLKLMERSTHKFSNATKNIVVSHHERLDGSGYPNEEEVEDLDEPSKILMVTDVFEAMSTFRNHRSPIPCDRILRHLNEHDEKFDEKIVNVLENTLGPYPPGTIVLLNSDEIGVAVEADNDTQHPTVKLIVDENGQVFSEPEMVNLGEETTKEISKSLGNRMTPKILRDSAEK